VVPKGGFTEFDGHAAAKFISAIYR